MNTKKITQNNQNILTLKFFRIAIYFWMLIYYNTLALKTEVLFGNSSFISYRKSFEVFGIGLLNLFQIEFIKQYPIILIIFLNIFIFCNLFSLKNKIFPLLIFYISFTLDNRAFPILDAGNNIITILLAYNIFFDLETRSGNSGVFFSTLSNLFLFMSRVQICLVYFIASYIKFQGSSWMNGTAIYYALSQEMYSFPAIQNLMKTMNYYLLGIVNYGVVIFQLLFPWLIWINLTKKLMLKIGLLFHLFIGIVMGLNYFALAFCVSYLLFYNEEDLQEFLSKFKLRPPSNI